MRTMLICVSVVYYTIVKQSKNSTCLIAGKTHGGQKCNSDNTILAGHVTIVTCITTLTVPLHADNN